MSGSYNMNNRVCNRPVNGHALLREHELSGGDVMCKHPPWLAFVFVFSGRPRRSLFMFRAHALGCRMSLHSRPMILHLDQTYNRQGLIGPLSYVYPNCANHTKMTLIINPDKNDKNVAAETQDVHLRMHAHISNICSHLQVWILS